LFSYLDKYAFTITCKAMFKFQIPCVLGRGYILDREGRQSEDTGKNARGKQKAAVAVMHLDPRSTKDDQQTSRHWGKGRE
jgi:hypothetical protein